MPAYTFHDGFSLYSDLLRGVLPTKLRSVSPLRFPRRHGALFARLPRLGALQAALHAPDPPDDWQEALSEAEAALGDTIPAVCAYFNDRAFADISTQFAQYRRDVDAHLAEFARAKELWARMKELL